MVEKMLTGAARRGRTDRIEKLLHAGFQTLPEGCGVYDAADRLMNCNAAYPRLFPGTADYVVPGATFRGILRAGLNGGHYVEAKGREEEWLTACLNDHRNPRGGTIHYLDDGRWILTTNRRLNNGWVVGLRIDVTEFKQAEQALRESEERFRSIVEAAPTATVMVTPDGQIALVNAAAERLFRYSRSELLDRPVEMLLPERYRQNHSVLRSKFFTGPQWRSVGADRDLFALRKDGREVAVEIGLSPVETRDGTMALSAIVDVSKLREAEARLSAAQHGSKETLAALKRSREHLALAQRLGRIGSVEIDIRTSQARWSAEMYRLYEIDPLPGVAPDPESIISATHPYDRAAVRAFIETVQLGGTPAPMESRILLRDGSIRWIRRVAELSADENGIPKQALVVNQDITERKLFEARVETERDTAQRYLDFAAVMLLVTNADGTVEQINRKGCEILEYEAPQEIIGKQWIENFVPERFRNEVRREFARFSAAEDPGVATHENPVLTRTGKERIIGWHNRTLSDDTGRPVAIVSSGEDITDRKHMEAQLRQAQKMETIGTLTGGIAHDFNNLLTVVIGNLELAREQIGDEGEPRELIGEALDAAWSGADLTSRLLAFARQQALRTARIDVNRLITDTVTLLRRLLGEGVEIALKLGEDVWPIVSDPSQLSATLTNLATNARDAMPKGGRLMIATANRHLDADYVANYPDATEGDFVLIEVSDTGTGIPAETIGKIFDPFFTTKPTGKGTGLGLSMVFGFLRQSRGHINVYSEPGVGSVFRLFFPRQTTEVLSQEVAAQPAAARGAGETLLVVEDNSAMRDLVRRQLTELGYRVLECDRPKAAIDVLEREKVDLVLSDIVMPGGIDGIELVRVARERWPTLKILLTSGFPLARIDAGGQALDSTQWLSKPYGLQELAAAVRTALDR
jgi:PAS domain S-box-containing protein